jgi:RNA polymerase sigma-B factor
MSDPGATDVNEMFVEYRRTGDRRLRDRLVEEHAELALRCARRFANRGEPLDDLTQVAMFGLLKAVERFEPGYGTPFGGFATPTIVGELRRHFRDRTWAVRVPRRTKDLHVRIPGVIEMLSHEYGRRPTVAEIAESLKVDEEEVLETLEAGAAYRSASLDVLIDQQSPVDESSGMAEHSDDHGVIMQLMKTLPTRERRIVYLRFFEELSQSEIADRLGISQVHVSRLLRSSLSSMRGELDDAPR